jgi:hypothetical protein
MTSCLCKASRGDAMKSLLAFVFVVASAHSTYSQILGKPDPALEKDWQEYVTLLRTEPKTESFFKKRSPVRIDVWKQSAARGWDNNSLSITLHYRYRDNRDVQAIIQLQYTPTHYHGRRLWFTCPLKIAGRACNRRAGKLYLPPSFQHFGCRRCHDLTYLSCQKAHYAERVSATIDRRLKWLDTKISKYQVTS